MSEYEDFVKTTDLKKDDEDAFQYYFDGYNEEHGEVFGVIQRMRRGDYGKRIQNYLIKNGLKNTLIRFKKCREDLIKEFGDEHWYKTRLLQTIGLTWKKLEEINISKLKKRKKQKQIIGHGSNREQ